MTDQATETQPQEAPKPEAPKPDRNRQLADQLIQELGVGEQPKSKMWVKEEATKAEEPAEKPEESKEPEKSPVELRLEKLEKQIEEEREKFQSRINQKTAKEKALEEELSKLKTEKLPDGEKYTKQDIVKEENKILSRMKKLQREKTQAHLDENDAKFDDLVEEEESLRFQIVELEREAREMDQRAKVREQDKHAEANHTLWVKSWEAAFDAFPELIKDGKPDLDNLVFQEARRLLGENGKKPKFAKKVDIINPKFDHENGPYFAVLQAVLNVRKSEGQTKKVESETKLKKENVKLKANAQLLTDDRSMGTPEGGQTMEEARLEKLREKSIAKGSTNQDIETYALARLAQVNRKLKLK